MIIFLIGIIVVSRADNLIVHNNSTAERINIEWTKTEKLVISFPIYHGKDVVVAPITTSPTTTDPTITGPTGTVETSRQSSSSPFAFSTQTNPEVTHLATEQSTSLSTTESTIAHSASPEVYITNSAHLSTETSTNSGETNTTVTTPIEPTTLGVGSTTTTAAYTEQGVTTEGTTTKPPPSCNESDGKDFIIMLDAAAMREREKTTSLVGVLAEIIRLSNPCNRLLLISYAMKVQVLIPLEQKPDYNATMDALSRIKFEEGSQYEEALHYTLTKIVEKMPWKTFEIVREKVLVMLAVADPFTDSPSRVRTIQSNGKLYRALLTDKYGAHIFMITVGLSNTIYYRQIVPEDERAKIDSFENFSLQPVREFCCRFSMCDGIPEVGLIEQYSDGELITNKDTEMCQRVREREQVDRNIYPRCGDSSKKGRDFTFLIDQASMSNRAKIAELIQGILNVIDPWNTQNRVAFAQYGNTERHVFYTLDRPTPKSVSEIIGKLEYEDGSDIVRGLESVAASYRRLPPSDSFAPPERERVVIIIASSEPKNENREQRKMEGNRMLHCIFPHYNITEFTSCAQSRIASRRAQLTGYCEAKIFLVTIGHLPLLKGIAPENETVRIDSFENFSLHPIDEFKRRFCF